MQISYSQLIRLFTNLLSSSEGILNGKFEFFARTFYEEFREGYTFKTRYFRISKDSPKT